MPELSLLGTTVPIAVALLLLLLASIGAGALGALLGLGGGIVLVPVLVLVFGVDIHLAVAASLVSVIATSSGAALFESEKEYLNLRLGTFLETSTSAGGLVGAVAAITLFAHRSDVLIAAFVPVVLIAAVFMYRARAADVRPDPPPDPLADRLHLHAWYPDPETGGTASYRVTRSAAGLAIASLAGLASGLFGLGGGVFKVPAMNGIMNVPIRVAGATSTFMIGVTAAAGALVYLTAGDVALAVAGPAAVGALLGSRLGAAARPETSTPRIKVVFALVLVLAAISMAAQAGGLLG